MQNFKKVQTAVRFIKEKLGGTPFPRLGVVLGTGQSGLLDSLQEAETIDYAVIPEFPRTTVETHAGRFLVGRLGDVPTVCLGGRFHLYEGYTPAEVCMGVRVLAGLGVTTLIVCNAAGALNPLFRVGDIMVVADQINFTGATPLAGEDGEAWGPRFPSMVDAYCPRLRQAALDVAHQSAVRLESGVYIGVTGPQFETPAEIRAFSLLGADAVGMSTVLETIAARQLGLTVLGLSCLTNLCFPNEAQPMDQEEVIQEACRVGDRLNEFLPDLVAGLSEKGLCGVSKEQ